MMKRSVGFLTAALLLALLLVFFAASTATAVEVELAGVRLDTPILNLLTTPGWGEPDGIGPVSGGVQIAQDTPRQTRTTTGPGPATGGAAMRRGGGPPGRMGGGSRAGGPPGSIMRGAAASGAQSQPRAAARAPARQAAQGTAKKGQIRGTRGLQYWYYRRPGGLKVVLGVEPSGNIATISAQGGSNTSVLTSRGVGLGDTYFDLQNTYGFPEKMSPIHDGVRITFPDEDVVFLLHNLTVTEIVIGRAPAPPSGAAQARTGRAVRPPSAGLGGARPGGAGGGGGARRGGPPRGMMMRGRGGGG